MIRTARVLGPRRDPEPPDLRSRWKYIRANVGSWVEGNEDQWEQVKVLSHLSNWRTDGYNQIR